MRVAVIGCGVVGGAVAGGLERLGHEVFRHDPAKYNTTLEQVIEFGSEISFVCVPTPQNGNGTCDTSIVEDVVLGLISKVYNGIIAIKSTVEPGFTDRMYKYATSYIAMDGTGANLRLKLAFVPEFLREAHAFHDFTEGHDICVIGTPKDMAPILASSIKSTLAEVHGKYPRSFHLVNSVEAELVKYFSNGFNALRIVWANAFYELCKKVGADYDKIKNAVCERPTITNMYLDCNENFRGFAGPCLPKDTAALAALAERLEVDVEIFRTIIKDNQLYRPTVPEGMRK